MLPGVLETPLQFVYVTALSSKRYFYHFWLLLITKSGKKSNEFNRLQIEVFSLANISPPPPPEYRPIKFVLCPYKRPGRINEILRHIKEIIFSLINPQLNNFQ